MHSDLQHPPLPKLSAALSMEKMSRAENEQWERAFGASQSYPWQLAPKGQVYGEICLMNIKAHFPLRCSASFNLISLSLGIR